MLQLTSKCKKKGAEINQLKMPDNFAARSLDIDYIELRLDVMLFVVELPDHELFIRSGCENIITACRIIESSNSYRQFLSAVLAVGNKMNEVRLFKKKWKFL